MDHRAAGIHRNDDAVSMRRSIFLGMIFFTTLTTSLVQTYLLAVEVNALEIFNSGH